MISLTELVNDLSERFTHLATGIGSDRSLLLKETEAYEKEMGRLKR